MRVLRSACLSAAAAALLLLAGACSDSSPKADTGGGSDSTVDGAQRDGGGDGAQGDQAVPDGPAGDTGGGDTGGGDGTTGDGGGDAPRGDAGSAPANQRCANPTTITLSSGKGSINGTTVGATDEFANVDCGNANGPWAGAQVYYKVSLKKGKLYAVTATFQTVDLALYAFKASTACTESAINAACAATNADDVSNGGSEAVYITPQADEDWVIAVDAFDAADKAPFTLTIEERDPPKGTKCASPVAITLAASGPTVYEGSSVGATDEYPTLACGNANGPWVGGQIYHKVTLKANTRYRLTMVSGGTDLSFYGFPAATTCSAAAINTACTSPTPADPYKVYNSDNIAVFGATNAEALQIQTGSTDEDWVLAVDSFDPAVSGNYTIRIVTYTPATNTTCAAAQSLALNTPVSGTTIGAADEFATIACGTQDGPWDGGQVYYKATLAAGTVYKAELNADFDGAVYAFPASTACTAAGINTGCTSPTPADPFNVYSSDNGSTLADYVWVKPAQAGDWVFAVDATAGLSGVFQFSVKAVSAPTNDKCAAPLSVALSSSPATINGDSSYPGLADEFATVDCGNANGPWPGPQLYYKLTGLKAGTTYTIALEQWGWDPALYAFPAGTACNATAINAACASPASDPKNVYNSESLGIGNEQLVITPKADGDWIVVVDGYATSVDASGSFKITVTW